MMDPRTDHTKQTQNLIQKAFLKSLPVMAGYLVLGTGYGILAYSHGLGIWWPVIMSLIVYAGSMQYMAIGLMSAGAGFLSTALTTLAVNARHLLYGISMLDKYKDAGRKKPYLIFSLTDETYSLLVKDDSHPENNHPRFYFFVSLFNQCYWVLGSIIGVLAGRILPINTAGIDFSLTALFVTVAVDQWVAAKRHWPAIAGLVCSVVCRFLFGADSFLIPAMIAIVIALCIPDTFRRLQNKKGRELRPDGMPGGRNENCGRDESSGRNEICGRDEICGKEEERH